MHIHVCEHTCIHTGTHICVHTWTCTCIHTVTCKCGDTHIYPHVPICWTEFKADVFSGALWSIYIVLKEKKLICDMRIISIREEWLHILL